MEDKIRLRGVIKVVNSRGFGFITCEEIDYFVHYTDYRGDWKLLVQRYVSDRNIGRKVEVEFDFDESSKQGPKAINVTEIVGELQ